MNSIFSCVVRNRIATLFKRKFHFTKNISSNEKKDEQAVQLGNPFCLEPIEYESYTLRKHDNVRRQRLYEFGLYVAACMPKFVQKIQMQHTDELDILIAPEGMFAVMNFMCYHQHACFNTCCSMSAIDVPTRQYRFEVYYNIRSLRFAANARIKTYTDELTPLPSGYSLWKVCNWYERETYDMFGIIFTHHPDLRRIITDYGFKGHPLRKDFPTVGYIEVRYDDELKKIVYEPVEFAQEMRLYNLESPWNYMRSFHEGYGCPVPKPDKK